MCDGVCVHYRLYEPDSNEQILDLEMDGLHGMIEGRTVVFFVSLHYENLCRENDVKLDLAVKLP